MLFRSIVRCDEPTNQDGGRAYSRDGSVGSDVARNTCVNIRDTVVTDFWPALDASLVEVRKGCKVSDAFMS